MVVGKEMIYDMNNLLLMNQIISMSQITEHQLKIRAKVIMTERSIEDNVDNIENIIIINVEKSTKQI